MKKTIIAILITLAFATVASADTYVNGYTRSDGTYVQGHWRSSPNGTTLDNYSTRGNVNPYTGQKGYKNPYGGSGYGYGQHKTKNTYGW